MILTQYSWQVYVAIFSMIPLYIIDIKFFMRKKVGLKKKIEQAKARGHVVKGTIIKKDAYRLVSNMSHSDSTYWGAKYTYTVKGKEYCKKFSADPGQHTRSPLRTIINVYWIDNPNKPFWDYSNDSVGTWYGIITFFAPIAIAMILLFLLCGGDISRITITSAA